MPGTDLEGAKAFCDGLAPHLTSAALLPSHGYPRVEYSILAGLAAVPNRRQFMQVAGKAAEDQFLVARLETS